MTDLKAALKQHFGFEAFRGAQESIISALLEGQNVLGIMTTGAGKSLCYQLPALLLPGVTLVISPLIALMQDQVTSLHRRGIREATYINSSLSHTELKSRTEGLRQGKYKLVYVAPERLRSTEFLALLQDIPVSLLVVDEAHCISEWGHDFRTDYLQIGSVREKLGKSIPVLALTATATPEVQEDILIHLRMEPCAKFVTGFDRPNLAFVFQREETREDKYREALSFLRKQQGAGIIYAPSRNECEEVTRYLQKTLGEEQIAFYHAGLHPEERRVVQDDFMQGRVRIVVATNAFGMGIDKPDIRFVLHLHVPASLEGYYQEAGRAGRDGQPSICMTIYNEQDRAIHHFFIKREFPSEKEFETACQMFAQGIGPDGVFRGSWREMCRWPGLDDERLSLLIHHWETVGAVEVHDMSGDFCTLRVDWDRVRGRRIDVLHAIERLKLRRFGKLNRVVELLAAPSCRREGILAYFGQRLTERPAICCDVCNPELRQNPTLVDATLAALDWRRMLADLFPEDKLDPEAARVQLSMTEHEEAYRVGEQKKADELPRLYELLRAPGVTTRRMACSAIGKIGAPESVPYLIPMIQDPNPQVRQYALKALAKIDDRRAIPAVQAVMRRREEKEYNVRQARLMLEAWGVWGEETYR